MFGTMGLVSPLLRFSPDYTISMQNLLLVLLEHQAKSDAETFLRNFNAVVASMSYISTAAEWFLILSDSKHEIDPRVVRRYVFHLIRLHSLGLRVRLQKIWQLKMYLRYKIPDMRHWAWRLTQRGDGYVVRHIENRPKNTREQGFSDE